MKKVTSLLVFCLSFGFIGSFLSINAAAQQKPFDNQVKTDKKGRQMNNNQKQTTPPVRPPEEVAYFQQLIEQAQNSPIGKVRATVGLRMYVVTTEFLKQLEPFNVTLVSNYGNYLTLDLDVAALIYLRDFADDVVTIRPNRRGYIQTEPPPRSPQQAAVFQKLIERATANGTAQAITVTRNFADREELLRQLAPFQVRVIALFELYPHVGLEANAAAFIYMRDSNLVTGIQENGLAFPTLPPVRSPEELAYFQRLIARATANGEVRVIVGLNTGFAPEGYLTPTQRAAQREAISLVQDEILRRLIPYQATLIKRYADVPYLVLEVDAAAINLMMYSRLVLKIRENRVKIQIQKSKIKY